MFELTGIGKDFVNKTMIAQALRPKINKWDKTKLFEQQRIQSSEEAAYRLERNLIRVIFVAV